MENEKLLLGDSLFKEGKYEDALNAYLDALFQMDPNAALFMKIAHSNKMIGDMENAREYYEKSLALDSDNLECLYNTADCYQVLQLHKEAIALFDRLISLGSNLSGNIAEVSAQRKKDSEKILQDQDALIKMMQGDTVFQNTYALELLNSVLGTEMTSFDTVMLENGHYRFVLYEDGKAFFIEAGEDEIKVIPQE